MEPIVMTERDKLAIEAVIELLPRYAKRFDFDLVAIAYAMADKTLTEIERTKK
jgi:hypothetical protein